MRSLAEPPDPLVGFASGEAVESVARWEEERAPELRALFAHYVYGEAPTGVVGVGSTVAARDREDIEVLELDLAVGAQPVEVVVFLPSARPAPVLLGLNKCGNHTISTEPEVRVPEVWPDPACGEEVGESGRGSHADEWPIVEAVARGFAVVSVAQASIDPDDPTRKHQASVGAIPGRVGPSPAPWTRQPQRSSGDVAAVAGGPGCPKEGALLSPGAALPARRCPSLQASSVCVPSTGGPRADLANDSITSSVAGATTPFRAGPLDRPKGGPQPHPLVTARTSPTVHFEGSPEQPGPWHPTRGRGRLPGEAASGRSARQ